MQGVRRKRDSQSFTKEKCERCGQPALVVICDEPVCGECIDLREIDTDGWMGMEMDDDA